MLVLYDFELSADCYRLRLMLQLLGVAFDTVPIDIWPGSENREEWFLALNPLGEVPVLVDGPLVIADAHAALVYLARCQDAAGAWLPVQQPPLLAAVETWLGFARRLGASAGLARAALDFGAAADLVGAQDEAHRLLRHLDRHLWFAERTGSGWLVAAAHPTIADVAVFPDVALCEEGGVSRQDYPAVRRWLDRVKRLPGFVVMSGIFSASPARD